jgi:hypothetical protein
VLVTANTVNMMPLKTMGTPIARYTWTLSISAMSIPYTRPTSRRRPHPPSSGTIGPVAAELRSLYLEGTRGHLANYRHRLLLAYGVAHVESAEPVLPPRDE